MPCVLSKFTSTDTIVGLRGVSNFWRKRENSSVSHPRTSEKRAISSLDLESPSWSFQNWLSYRPVGPVGPVGSTSSYGVQVRVMDFTEYISLQFKFLKYLSILVSMILAQNGHRETIPEVDFDILLRNQKDNQDTRELGIQVGNCHLKWTNCPRKATYIGIKRGSAILFCPLRD